MQKVRMLAKALNIALAELRVASEDGRTNYFDHVMKHFPQEVRDYIKMNQSPVYWDNNDYDPEYVAKMEATKKG